jgi:hypothetical protein
MALNEGMNGATILSIAPPAFEIAALQQEDCHLWQHSGSLSQLP